MKNREKYREQIMNADKMSFCEKFIKPTVLNYPQDCRCEDIDCSWCQTRLAMWLDEEYEEPKVPEVDWSKVEVDTKVLVSDTGRTWYKRYFAEYKDGKVHTWFDGATSWTAQGVEPWGYAKLAEEE